MFETPRAADVGVNPDPMEEPHEFTTVGTHGQPIAATEVSTSQFQEFLVHHTLVHALIIHRGGTLHDTVAAIRRRQVAAVSCRIRLHHE